MGKINLLKNCEALQIEHALHSFRAINEYQSYERPTSALRLELDKIHS